MRLFVLVSIVCAVYVAVALLAPDAADVIVVPAIALMLVPTLMHRWHEDREHLGGSGGGSRSTSPRFTVGA